MLLWYQLAFYFYLANMSYQSVLNKKSNHQANDPYSNEIFFFISADALADENDLMLYKNLVYLSMSSGLRKKFLLCQNLNDNCVYTQLGVDDKITKITVVRLDNNIGLDYIQNFFLKFLNSASYSSSLSTYKPQTIFLISNKKYLSMFRLVLNQISNGTLYHLDTEKFSQNPSCLIEDNLSTNLNLISDVKLKSLSPNIESALEIINYIRSLNKLENVHFYVTDSTEKYLYIQRKQNQAHSFLSVIDNINKLIKNLILIANNIENKSNRLNLNDYLIRTYKIRSAALDQNDQVIASFKQIEKFFFSNDLIVLKCSFKNLYTILNQYNSLRNRYFSHQLSNISFYRYLIWIPERASGEFDESYQSIFGKVSQMCNSFRIYLLNWFVDVDQTLNKIIYGSTSLNDFLLSGKYSLKIFLNKSSCDQTSDSIQDSGQNEFYFKVKQDKVFQIDSNEDPFSFVKLINLAVKKGKKSQLTKPSYRIVSNHVEPFVIVSQLDEHLVSKDECKDGIPCLDIESDERFYRSAFRVDSNLTQEMNNVFNKELMIGLIKGFKYFSDDYIQSNKTSLVKTKCCTGYMIDLLQRLSQDADFDFELYFSPDKKFGHFNQSTSEWTGAINHVISGVADMAAGPYSITEDRSRYVDFSTPFLYSGYSLLIKQEKKGVDDLWLFMRPFTYLHWAVICFFAFLSAFSVALLEFNSPFGLNPKGRQRARNYTLGSAISMVISLMFMHTMPAKSPKSWAGKWTQNFVASFALIFIATYTAKMASILSAGQDTRAFKGIDDRELLTMKRGYLQSSSIQSHMCRNSKEFYKSHCKNSIYLRDDIDGIKSVMNGSLDVYISDHLLLNYMRFKETDCNLQITGQDFAINGYAFPMSRSMSQKEKNDINIQILDYYETGYLDELYSKWFNKRIKCNRKTSDDKIRIDVDQYKGVFAFLGLGVLAAVTVLFLEQALYKWTIPFLRDKPKKSEWKSLKLMFISQRFYRIVHSEEVYDASHSAKEFINVFKRRDFEAIFQKSFRKKQLESMHGSQLRKRPKLWALIEASTERRSRDLINRTSSSEASDSKPDIDVSKLPKDKIVIVKFNDQVDINSDSESKQKSADNLNQIILPFQQSEDIQLGPVTQSSSEEFIESSIISRFSVNKCKLRKEKSINDDLDDDDEEEEDDDEILKPDEFDEQIYLAVVSTPALEEPEVFNISSSSSSLLALKSETSFNVADNNNNINNNTNNDNQSSLVDSPRINEFNLIHALFAKKT